jgi:NAD(P)-dependent dehydrogenase (short-subunit alcohol dehydrogenase family)
LEVLKNEMKNKVIVITGGNKGIGKGCAKVFCEVLANVVICGRNEKDGEETEIELNKLNGGRCSFFKCDVSKEKEVEALIEYTAEKYGRIDCMINNAGYYPPEKPIDEVTVDEVEEVIRTNFIGIFCGCKHSLPYLRKSKGSIINMSSVLSNTGMEGALAYTATKGAIVTFTKTLAIDESRNGVRVNVVLPGNITTEMFETNKAREADPEAFQKYQDHVQWMGRGGRPEEVGSVCLFLASSLASFVTGAELLITGGYEIGEGEKYHRMNWEGRMMQK